MAAMNSLLQEMYSQPIRLSHILAKHGVSQSQIEEWQADPRWLSAYLDRLIDGLRDLVTVESADIDPLTVFQDCGWVDGRTSGTDFRSQRVQLVESLCSEDAKAEFEELAVKSTRFS
jgi:hypothetical protein